MTQKKPPSVAVISSHVVRGSVGNRAAVLALESLGLPVWAVATINLPWHPGHGPSTRIVPDDALFRSLLDDLSGSKFSQELGAILTGYLATTEQVKSVATFIKACRVQNPELFYVCDPVIGDEAGLYISEDIARAIRDELLPLANVITPNRFELAWLSGSSVTSNEVIVSVVRDMKVSSALVTSAFGMLKNSTGNLFVDEQSALLAEHRQIENAPNGVGDLTAALFMARRLANQSIEDTLRATTQSVFELLMRTQQREADELTIESDVGILRKPSTNIQVRSIGTVGRLRPA
ncbi:MAG: pyridoxal kinase [Pseudomonadota bacterium]